MPRHSDRIFATEGIPAYTKFGTVNCGAIRPSASRPSSSEAFLEGADDDVVYTFGKAMDESDNDGVASGVTYYNRRLKARAVSMSAPQGTYPLHLPSARARSGCCSAVESGTFLGGGNRLDPNIPERDADRFRYRRSPNRYLPATVRPTSRESYDRSMSPVGTSGPVQ